MTQSGLSEEKYLAPCRLNRRLAFYCLRTIHAAMIAVNEPSILLRTRIGDRYPAGRPAGCRSRLAGAVIAEVPEYSDLRGPEGDTLDHQVELALRAFWSSPRNPNQPIPWFRSSLPLTPPLPLVEASSGTAELPTCSLRVPDRGQGGLAEWSRGDRG